MKTIRYLLRFLAAFIQRFRWILLVGSIIGVIIFLTISFVMPRLITRKTERVGLTGRFYTENLPPDILYLIGSGLTQIGKDGSVESGISNSWETPDKGKTWLFTIDQESSWQDGKKVKSEDIVYNFSDVEIKYPNEDTIEFKLQDSFSPFPGVVSKPVFRKGLLGTGSWEVSSISVASGNFVQKLTLVDISKNKTIFKFYPTEQRTKLAFKLGEVDKIIDVFNYQPFGDWKNTRIVNIENKNRIVVIFFNTQAKALSDKSLRQALAYAIDKASLDGDRAISPVSPLSWAYNSQVKDYQYSSKRAKELINDLPDELKSDLKLKLATSPVLLSVAEKIANYWKEVGIDASVQVSSGVPEQFQAYLAIFDVPTDPDQYAMWHSTQTSTNISKYSNPRIDKLLEDGRIELNIDERHKIYLDFQRFLVEDSPAIFLYHPILYKITRN